MTAQRTLTPSFKAFQALAGSLKDAKPDTSDMVLELRHLLARASQEEEGTFKARIKGFLGHLKRQLEGMSYQDYPGVFQNLEKLMSHFAPFIAGVEPNLAHSIQSALTESSSKEQKAEALCKLLEDQTFSGALANNLQAFLSPKRLNEQEKMDQTLEWAFESIHQDNTHTASQAAYGENAWVRQLLRLLFSMVKMVANPPLRGSSSAGEGHPEAERRIPMPAGPR